MTAQDFSVLIADDNELNRWLLCEQLRQWTTNITAAQEGREAWRLLQAKKYSLIFLDVNMPFLNGLDLIEKIKMDDEALNRFTPAIAVTAHTHDRQRQTLIAAGFNDCLVKPVLLQHVKQVMEQWQSSTGEPAYYAAQIAKKTEFNLELSQLLLNKLFLDVPELLLGIAKTLQPPDCQQAWQIAHKLHGTFCFYSFADFLPMMENLEQCLLNSDIQAANTQLCEIQKKFSALLNNKAVILANIADGMSDL